MFEIKISNLVKKYHYKEILNIKYLEFREGEVVGIIGKNGSGKTTLAEIVIGTKEQSEGSVDYSLKDIRRNAVFQESNFDDEVDLRYTYSFYKKLFLPSDSNDELIAEQEEDFKRYGLDGLEKQTFSSLSGGQKQRFKMMISMLNEPQLVLFDEVTNSLDLKTRKWFQKNLAAKKAAANSIILVISHDPSEVYELCTRVIKIENHHISYDADIKKDRVNVKKIEELMEDD